MMETGPLFLQQKYTLLIIKRNEVLNPPCQVLSYLGGWHVPRVLPKSRNRSCCLPTRGGLEASTGAITTKSALASIPGKASLGLHPGRFSIVAPTDPLKILQKGMGQDLKTWVSEQMFHEISIYLHLTNAKACAFVKWITLLLRKFWGLLSNRFKK